MAKRLEDLERTCDKCAKVIVTTAKGIKAHSLTCKGKA